MRKGILFTMGIALGGCAILTGCNDQASKAANTPAPPKWKGAPYHITFDTAPAKPDASGVTIPAVKYDANPDALEKRASLIVRFDASTAKTNQPVMDQMIMAAIDVPGANGALPADYMSQADKGLAKLLTAYCMKGKIKINVALARSSITPQADDSEVNQKRLSDWLPMELTFKNSHGGC